jgi:hypothetical protein
MLKCTINHFIYTKNEYFIRFQLVTQLEMVSFRKVSNGKMEKNGYLYDLVTLRQSVPNEGDGYNEQNLPAIELTSHKIFIYFNDSRLI